jgi:hypothetical protein
MIKKIRFVPSKRRIWLGCIASSLLVVLGCVVVNNGDKFGWFLIIVFGLGVFAPGLLLLPGASWLELDEDGFTLCLSFRPDRYLWSHITEMAVWQGIVSFKLDPEYRGNRRGQTTARAISGYDGSIPDIFRLHPQSLLELMMEFKQHKMPQAIAVPPHS